MNPADPTIASSLRSWVESANAADSHFPIQNLPYGVFKPSADAAARVGVAIGDQILDLALLEQTGLLRTPRPLFATGSLNAFMAAGRDTWRSVRGQVSTLLAADTGTLRDDAAARGQAMVPQAGATLLLPVEIPGYTDFYSSKEHATNVGALFRDPKNALLPNWLEIPIGYNGRASSVVVSGTPVRRPNGQIKLPSQERPVFSPCLKLDFELETGFFVGVPNGMAEPVSSDEAESHIFGMVLLNDWSARDIQAWEYVPLGPFNSKGFPVGGHDGCPGTLPHPAAPAGTRAPALPAPRRPARLRHPVGSLAAPAGPGPGIPHRPHQLQAHVLDDGSTTGAPYGVRLQHPGGGPDGIRHDQRARCGLVRIAAGAHQQRQESGGHGRGDPRLHRGRR